MQKLSHYSLCLIALISFISCADDSSTTQSDQSEDQIEQLTVRLTAGPDRLNPILSKTPSSTPIENLILVSPCEYDPTSLELEPVLLTAVPEGLTITDGEFAGKMLYQLEFRDDARWEDGSAVTGADYEFTLKVVFNPYIKASWRNLLSDIIKVYYDPQNPLVVGSVVAKEELTSVSTVANFNLYPEYAYDPDGLLREVPLDDLLNKSQIELEKLYPQLQAFASQFSSDRYSREVVTGAGPYKLSSWQADLSLTLESKTNYWGQSSSDEIEALSAGVDRIDYRIIPDENTAITALRDGQIDLMADISPLNFAKLQSDDSDGLSFYTPQVMRYYYVAMNGNDPRLEETEVRRAMAHLLNVDELIDQLMGGLAMRTIGPVHPSKEFYNRDLRPIEFSRSAADSLLSAAGWEDVDQDGWREKVKNGRTEKLSFTLKTTSRQLGQQIGAILQENAQKVGVEIKIETQDIRSILEDIRKGSFDFANLAASQFPGFYDPYSSWHTNSIGNGGRNYLGFGSDESDALIEIIGSTKKQEERYEAYEKFQRMIYDAQPAIFLFSPVERIAASSQYKLLTSSRRPGYFENCLTRTASQ